MSAPVIPWVGVELLAAPWNAGLHTLRVFGAVSAELFCADEKSEPGERAGAWDDAEAELYAAIRGKAAALGANAVVGFEVLLDPFDASGERVGLRLHAAGTAVLLGVNGR